METNRRANQIAAIPSRAIVTDVERPSLVRGLTLVGTVALIVGNMVGTSIYTLPASLADSTGPLGLVAWVFTAIGYFLVALVYANLGSRYPRTGGPYVFAREAFGEFAGFQTVWAYWFSAVIGNAAIATGVVGYAVGFSSALSSSVWLQFALAQLFLWGLCALNVVGIRHSARAQITLVILNLVPLVILSLLTLPAFDASNLTPFAPNGLGAIAVGAALIVWAYSGIESATVPAEEVEAPERTIRVGTMAGYAVGTLVFLLAATAVAGALPNAVIASSPRPIALAVESAVGPRAGVIIGMAAIVAGLGTLNGWILMAGRIPLAASEDGIFFRRLGAVHPRYGTPHIALIAGTAVSSLMLVLYFSKTLLGVFKFIVLLSVLTTLLPHLYAMAAELMLARRHSSRYSAAERRRAHVVAPLAFAFVLYTIYGVGAEVVLWGFIVLLCGIPLYIWFKTRNDEMIKHGSVSLSILLFATVACSGNENAGREGDGRRQERAAPDSPSSECAAGALPPVTPGGVGPVRLGQTAGAMAALCEARDTTFMNNEGMSERGIVVRFGDQSILALTTGSTGGEINRIIVESDRFRTERGLGVGSTVGQLRHAYAQICAGVGEGIIAVWTAGLPGVSFETTVSPAALLRTGRRPELDPSVIPDSARVTKMWMYDAETPCGGS